MFQIIAIATCLAAVGAVEPYGGHGGGGGGGHHEQDYYTEPHYSFIYEVKDLHTQDIKSHKEERKGEHTQGVYELVEPDGSNRKVEYIVEGKSGFNAVVHREHIKHPVSTYKAGYSSGGSGGYGSGGGSDYNSGGGFGRSGAFDGVKGGANSYSRFPTKGSLGGGYKVQSEREYGDQSGFGGGNSRGYSSGVALQANYGGHSSSALLNSYEGEGGRSLGGHSVYSLGDYGGSGGPSYGGHSSSAYSGNSQNDATSYASFSLHGNLGGQDTAYSAGLQGGYGGHSSGAYSNSQQADYSSGGATSYASYLSQNGGLRGQPGGGYQAQPQIAYHYGQSAGSRDNEGYSGGPSSGGYGGHSTGSSGGYAGAVGGGEHATSSVKFSTHGAKVATSTHHIIPAKHHSSHY